VECLHVVVLGLDAGNRPLRVDDDVGQMLHTDVLREPIGKLAGLYGSSFELGVLGPEASGILLASGIALGWLGSYIAATRHLRKIEPT